MAFWVYLVLEQVGKLDGYSKTKVFIVSKETVSSCKQASERTGNKNSLLLNLCCFPSLSLIFAPPVICRHCAALQASESEMLCLK